MTPPTTPDSPPQATRVIIISDLHLGGTEPHMMSRPDKLTSFVTELDKHIGLRADERLELILAGDVIDFLSVHPWQAWTPVSARAVAKLRSVMDQEPFACVFDGLAQFLLAGHLLTIIVGNHDVEMTIPAVQAVLFERLRAKRGQVRFIDDGAAYQIGRLFIEHGNRYDGANANDWAALRAHRSALSRYEEAPPALDMHVSAGSQLVQALVNPFKKDYPFIDLLHPTGELTALLLLACEPRRIDFKQVRAVVSSALSQANTKYGLQPEQTYQVSGLELPPLKPELLALFGERYQLLRIPPEQTVSANDSLFIMSQFDRFGIGAMLRNEEVVPEFRLREIHEVLRNILQNDDTYDYHGDTGPAGMAAARIITSSREQSEPGLRVDTVIMGHTHLARVTYSGERPIYINTGTWADLLYVPAEVTAPFERAREHFAQFLADLVFDRKRAQHYTYADVRVEPDGSIAHASLHTYFSTMQGIVRNARSPRAPR